MSLIDPLISLVVTEDERNMATLTCAAKGLPLPSFTWLPEIPGAVTVENINSADENGLISITSIYTLSTIERSDAGNYTCIASNRVLGSTVLVNKTVLLLVNCEFYTCIIDD